MTFEQAIQLLRGSGMIVHVEESAVLAAAADPEEPDEEVRQQGVAVAYRFGFSLRQIDDTWFLHLTPQTPPEQFARLQDAVIRGLRIFDDYRKRHSPREYCDQFATVVAENPCPIVERALVAAGWMRSQHRLAELGLTYIGSAHFSVPFEAQRRIVTVSVEKGAPDVWHLVIRCHGVAYSHTGPPVPIRSHDREGNVIADPEAPELSYRVAVVVHSALALAATSQSWALHSAPSELASSHAPIVPSRA
ncbi:MAG TPA: hypothetical protein VER96_35570 [Polyangiaceae bacterium]|nr:hypothetical protein [Polyangiaceae bacterium]